MIRIAIALLLIPLAHADPGQACKLDGIRFVNGDASWDDLFNWAKAKHELESQRGQLTRPIVMTREARLKTMARPIGKRFPVVHRLAGDRVRQESGSSVYLLQLGAKGHFAQLTPASKRALVVDMAFKKSMAARMKRPTPLALKENAGAGKKTLFGLPCAAYDVTGNGKGRVWIHRPTDSAATLKALAKAAERDLGRLDGSIHLACAKLGGVPVLAKIVGVKGMTVSGNELGGKLVLATWRVGRDVVPNVSVPEGWTVQRIPPR